MAIVIQFVIDEHGTIQDVQRINKELRATEGAGRQGSQGLKSVNESLITMKGLLPQITAGFVVWKGLKLGRWALETAGNFERMRITLDTLTKGEGAKWFEQINTWAIKMPVTTAQGVQAFVRLRAMGLQPTIKDMTTLIDTTSALGGQADTLDGIVLAIGQIATKNKLMAQEIRQLAERGIPAYEILMEKLGITGEELEQMGAKSVSAHAAIRALMEGMEERFGGQSEKIRGTYTGVITEIKSNWIELTRLMMDRSPFEFVKNRLTEIRDMMGENVIAARKQEEYRLISEYKPFSEQETISMKYMTAKEIEDWKTERAEQAREIQRGLMSGKPFGLQTELQMNFPEQYSKENAEKAREDSQARLDLMRKNLATTFGRTFVEFGQGYSMTRGDIGMFGGYREDYKNPLGGAWPNLDAVQKYNEQILDLRRRADDQAVELSEDKYAAEISLMKKRFDEEYGMLSANSELRKAASVVLENDISIIHQEASEERRRKEEQTMREMENAVVQFGQTWGSVMQQVVRDGGNAFDIVKSFATNALISVGTAGIGNMLFNFVPGGFMAGAGTMLKHMFGFDEGGYTGSGSPGQIAGVVHRREYVMPSDVTDAYGSSFFDRLVSSLRNGTGDNRRITNNFAFSPAERREMMNLDDEQLAVRMQRVIDNRKVVF